MAVSDSLRSAEEGLLEQQIAAPQYMSHNATFQTGIGPYVHF